MAAAPSLLGDCLAVAGGGAGAGAALWRGESLAELAQYRSWPETAAAVPGGIRQAVPAPGGRLVLLLGRAAWALVDAEEGGSIQSPGGGAGDSSSTALMVLARGGRPGGKGSGTAWSGGIYSGATVELPAGPCFAAPGVCKGTPRKCRFTQAGRRLLVGSAYSVGSVASVAIWRIASLIDGGGSSVLAAELVEEARFSAGWGTTTAGGTEGIKGDPPLPLPSPPTVAVTCTILLGSEAAAPAPTHLATGLADGTIELLPLLAGRQAAASTVQRFRGHQGAVLCMAEFLTPSSGGGGKGLGRSNGAGRHVLLSGGQDGTVRAWALDDGGTLLAVLRHHVAPLHSLVLPPAGTPPPWAACFLSAGGDGGVALVSTETWRCERLLPGHPGGAPRFMVWEPAKGYLAVASITTTAVSGTEAAAVFNPRQDAVLLWDLHSGSLDRVSTSDAAQALLSFLAHRQRKAAERAGAGAGAATGLLGPLWPPGGRDTELLSLPQEEGPAGGSSSAAVAAPAAAAAAAPATPLQRVSSGLELIASVFAPAPAVSTAAAAEVEPLLASGSHAADLLQRMAAKLPPAAVPGPLQQRLVPTPPLPPAVRGVLPLPGIPVLLFDVPALLTAPIHPQPQQPPGAKLGIGAGAETLAAAAPAAEPSQLDEGNGSGSGGSEEAAAPAALRLALALLHEWGICGELDDCLHAELDIAPPAPGAASPGLAGDGGAATLCLLEPPSSRLHQWVALPEFSASRSLAITALAQRLMGIAPNARQSCSMLASHYSRGLAEKMPSFAPPSLEVLACYWQHPVEHLRQAAKSLFHCSATRSFPPLLRSSTFPSPHPVLAAAPLVATPSPAFSPPADEGLWDSTEIYAWLHGPLSEEGVARPTEGKDARAVRIVVAAALAMWYPSLGRPDLPPAVTLPLLELARSAASLHAATAAEFLAEGMASTWLPLIGPEVPRLIIDAFALTESLGTQIAPAAATPAATVPAPALAVLGATLASSLPVAVVVREVLGSALLPALAAADVPGFLHVIQGQLGSSSPTSPVHVVALLALVRAIRANPRAIVSVLLHTMDPGNPMLRRTCLQSAMAVVMELVRNLPMVAFHRGGGGTGGASGTSAGGGSPRLAVGDALGDISCLGIHIYDLRSVSKVRILDASGPPGHPGLMGLGTAAGSNHHAGGGSLQAITLVNLGGISAVAFLGDGEGLIAFSQRGMVLRWWSLGANWWQKLNRGVVTVQCTKMVLVPPLPGLSQASFPSLIGTLTESECGEPQSPTARRLSQSLASGGASPLQLALQTLDLSFRLEWRPVDRRIALHHQGKEDRQYMSKLVGLRLDPRPSLPKVLNDGTE
eukprot:SM000241S08506  [mRNA]  locus=s241:23861:30392:+ [translate_table: standard]